MTRLVERAAVAEVLPRRRGGVTLEAVETGPVTLLLAYPGAAGRVDAALRDGHGVGWPAPNRAETAEGLRLVWAGLDAALALGARPTPEGAAAIDQSDAWAALALRGTRAWQVLARLCPLDLRPHVFAPGAAARSLLGHIEAVFVAEADGVTILVPRSMADHAVDDIDRAMRGLAARP